MSNTSKAILGIALVGILGGGGTYAGFTIAENNKLKNDNKSLTETVTEITDENTQLKKDKQKLYELITGKDNQITELQLGLETANKLKAEKEQELESLNIDLAEKTQLIEETNQIIENLNSKYDTLSQEKENLQTSLNECNNLLTEKTNQYNQVCADLETANGNITDLQNQKSQLENEITTLTSTKQSLQSELNTKTQEYNDKVQELETAQNNITALQSEKQELQSQVTNKTTEIENLNTTITSLNSTIQSLQAENVRLKSLLNDAGISYKVPGLYTTDTDTLTKSWQQLIDDGDITISGDELKFSNTSLTGDLKLGDCSNVVHLNAAFEFTHLNSVDFTNSNITAVADTSYCFGSSTIKKVIFDFSKMDCLVLDAFFSSCPITEIVGIEKLNTSGCVSFTYMFSSVSFSSLDVSFFDFSKAVDITGMFRSNSSLKNVNLGSFNFSSSCTIKDLFVDCPALTDITYAGTIEEWKAKNITNATTGIKEDGTVTVHCSDGDYVIGNSTETPTEQTDGLEGTYICNSFTITLDGKGNGTFNNGNEYSFTYTGDGDMKNVSSFEPFDGNANNFVVTSNGIKVHFSDEYGDTVLDLTFTKQTS